MQRADERGKDNMSHGHGNHSAKAEVAAAAGKVRNQLQADGSGRRAGDERRVCALGQAAEERRGGRVPGSDAALQNQQLQMDVPEGVARGAQQGGQGAGLLHIQTALFPGKVLFFAQPAPAGAAQGEAPLEGGDARAKGDASAQAQFDGKFYRYAAQIEQQRGDCGNVYGQVHISSTIVKTFFPN